MKIKIYTKNFYSRDYNYLEDIKKRIAFKRLTGRKTITDNDFSDLEKITEIKIEVEKTPYVRKSRGGATMIGELTKGGNSPSCPASGQDDFPNPFPCHWQPPPIIPPLWPLTYDFDFVKLGYMIENLQCEHITPKTFNGETPTTTTDFWQYSQLNCSTTQYDLMENASSGTSFFLDKTINYGDVLIVAFLMIFLIFGIVKFVSNLIIPKIIDFKKH